ncbi:MAG: C39 family peptidase [Flammeovirgaceae bacterium]
MSLKINILPQPDDVTCGPTSLHAVYEYYGYHIPLDQLIREVNYLEEGGTLAVLLGIDAIRRGFKAKLYSYNLKVFDLTWSNLSNEELIVKLKEQLKVKKGVKFTFASKSYIEFLELGGKIVFEDLHSGILKRYFSQNIPILSGLSATYLYNSKREYTNHKDQSIYDDIKGYPMGHFVVLSGMINENEVLVADPYSGNPFSKNNYYKVNIQRLINSILLGIVTYDANLLIITQ